MAHFQSMWIGNELSPLERLCIHSFLQQGHSFDLYTDGALEVPAGCQLRSISEICPDIEPFAYSSGFGAGSFSAFSNLFRYSLLYELGGWWVDLDVFCLADVWPQNNIVLGLQDEDKVNCAVMFAGSRGLALFEEARDLARAAGKGVKWGETGPNLVTRLMRGPQYQAEVTLLASNAFYPVGHRQFLDFFVPGRETLQTAKSRGSYCIHFWNEMFRHYKLNKDILPPAGSLLRECYESCGMGAGFNLEYVVDPKVAALRIVPT